MPTKLMGVDVGFSKTRRSTGIACLEGDRLSLERAGTTWESREAKIPKGFHPSVIAIDGPLLPVGADEHIRRYVELLFVRPRFTTVANPASVIVESDFSLDRLHAMLMLNLALCSNLPR